MGRKPAGRIDRCGAAGTCHRCSAEPVYSELTLDGLRHWCQRCYRKRQAASAGAPASPRPGLRPGERLVMEREQALLDLTGEEAA